MLSRDQARKLLKSIDSTNIADLRDRALIALMIFSFARVEAVVGMNREDYHNDGTRFWFRLHEKGGKRHEVPAHQNAKEFMDTYLRGAGIAFEKKEPLFRSIDRHGKLTSRRLYRREVLSMSNADRAEQDCRIRSPATLFA